MGHPHAYSSLYSINSYSLLGAGVGLDGRLRCATPRESGLRYKAKTAFPFNELSSIGSYLHLGANYEVSLRER